LSNHTFCIFKHETNPYTETQNIFPGVYVNKSIPEYKNHYIIVNGDIYNIKDIKEKFRIESEATEEIILELYLKAGVKTPNYLRGIYTIVIISNEKMVFFRDFFSINSIYYYVDDLRNEFIITNKISEIKRFVNLRVDTRVLPRYFLRTSLHIGDTFFENVKTLEYAQLIELSLDDSKVTPILYDDSFYKEIRNDQLKDNSIINKAEDIIFNNIKEIVNYYDDYNVINALSGGVDSSCLQVFLKKLGYKKAYTYSHEIIGTRLRGYSTDISKYLDVEHTIIELESERIIDRIKNGILYCEVPYMFEGEFLEQSMYDQIRKTEGGNILITHGQGSDAIFGYGRAFFELKYFSNPLFRVLFTLFNESFLKIFRQSYYSKYKTIIPKIKHKKIDEELLYVLFDSKYNGEIVRKAFNLDNMYEMYSGDVERLNKFDINYIDAIHRSRYDFDCLRASFMTYESCKKYGINTCFPFINKELLFYMCSVPLKKKIRRLTTKYYIKKILLKYLPSKFVYRTKVFGANQNFLFFFNDENINKIIQDIKNTKYEYFNFDYEQIFSDVKYYGLAIKLINFHIWHKIFIENVDIKDI